MDMSIAPYLRRALYRNWAYGRTEESIRREENRLFQQAASPILVPATFVQDILHGQVSATIPLSAVMAAAKDLPSFFIYDVVGLWAGDPNPDLVSGAKSGDCAGVGPMVAVEIKVSTVDRGQEELR